MDTLSTDLTPPEAPETSTVITEAAPVEPNQHKALSRDDAVEKAMNDLPEIEDDTPKPKTEETDKPDADEKPEKPIEKVEADDKPEAKTEDAKPKEPKAEKSHIEAPAKFLPAAKEMWRNVPHQVRTEVTRLMAETDTEVASLREQTQRYEAIKPYDDLARQSGRAGVHESLEEVRQLEDLMQQNPIAALAKILNQAGPRKADGQPVSLFEVATHIVNQGQQGYQQMVAQRPQIQQQGNSEIEALRAKVEQMETSAAAREIIEPFRAAHPRYDELRGDIAFFLQSGKVPTGLAPQDRLAAAYDMAVRINPTSHVATPDASDDDLADNRRAGNDFGGSRSIKGAPPSGVDGSKPRRRLSKDEAISNAMAQIFD